MLRFAINRTCPVNKLPPEMLTRCFLYLTPDFPLTFGPPEDGNENEWIRVAHVCKYWRAVVLEFPGLWDTIEFTRPEILDMYRKLSGSLPLEVCLQHVGRKFYRTMEPEPCLDLMLDMLYDLGSRIRRLIIHKKWIPTHDRCKFLAKPLPELEMLAITSDVGWENGSIDRPLTRVRRLFNGDLPRLRRLFIPESTPWPYNDFKNLKPLCLYNQFTLENELPQLLQMLRESPTIEELYIRQREYSHGMKSPPQNLGPTFQAHSLKKLRLHDFSVEAIVYILSTMQLQPNGVAVSLSDTILHGDSFARIFPLFPPECALGKTEKLEVYHDSREVLGIIFCGTGGSFKIGGSLSWHDGNDGAEAGVRLLGYVYQECAQTLKELWIHSSHDDKECYIFNNFSCYNLEKLVLVESWSNVSEHLCEVLDPRGPRIRDVPAPRLQSLTIHGISKQSQLERLIALCEGRSKTDHPLQEVSVCGHEGLPEWMTRLCGLSSTPIHIDPWDEWDAQLMELPTVCKEDEIWWPTWEEPIDDSSQNGS